MGRIMLTYKSKTYGKYVGPDPVSGGGGRSGGESLPQTVLVLRAGTRGGKDSCPENY